MDTLPIAPLSGKYTSDPPFSFVFGGRKSSDLLKEWAVEHSSREIDSQRTEHTQIYKDSKTGLEVHFVGVEYHDFPAVEWTLYFKNTGAADTPILENIQALDTTLQRNGEGEFLLHHNKGAPASPNDYEPYETPLEKNAVLTLGAREVGHPTRTCLTSTWHGRMREQSSSLDGRVNGPASSSATGLMAFRSASARS